MTLRVDTAEDRIYISLNEDVVAEVNGHGLQIWMESGVGRVKVCELDRGQAQEFDELLTAALNI